MKDEQENTSTMVYDELSGCLIQTESEKELIRISISRTTDGSFSLSASLPAFITSDANLLKEVIRTTKNLLDDIEKHHSKPKTVH